MMICCSIGLISLDVVIRSLALLVSLWMVVLILSLLGLTLLLGATYYCDFGMLGLALANTRVRSLLAMIIWMLCCAPWGCSLGVMGMNACSWQGLDATVVVCWDAFCVVGCF